MNSLRQRCCVGLLSLLPALLPAQSGPAPAPVPAKEKPAAPDAARAPVPAPVARTVPNAPLLPGKDGAPPPKKIQEGLVTGQAGDGSATPVLIPLASTIQPVAHGPVLPGKDGKPPPPKAGVARTTGDEDEMDDLDVQRRTAPSDEGAPALPAPGTLTVVGKKGRPPAAAFPKTGSGVARTTGDEDEMDDLDVQRRTASTDEGATPLATPGKGVVPKPGSTIARTTGDEDEMDDLDVQRRTVPGDLGDQPLPALSVPVSAKAKDALTPNSGVGVVPLPVKPRQGTAVLPAMLPAAATPLQLPKTVFGTSELITVDFTGVPGNAHDWICIAPFGAPDDKYDEWTWLAGQTAGTHRFARLLKPGRYEVRLYHNWPEGRYVVQSRAAFEVK